MVRHIWIAAERNQTCCIPFCPQEVGLLGNQPTERPQITRTVCGCLSLSQPIILKQNNPLSISTNKHLPGWNSHALGTLGRKRTNKLPSAQNPRFFSGYHCVGGSWSLAPASTKVPLVLASISTSGGLLGSLPKWAQQLEVWRLITSSQTNFSPEFLDYSCVDLTHPVTSRKKIFGIC